jgi:antitoxin (DNA-binding transcriptional repressor) of toxin-antitoxin stability system
VSALIARIAEEADREPERVLPVLYALLGEEVEITDELRPTATLVGERRRRGALRAFKAEALTTAAVAEQLGVSTPQAVHQMRSRGKLLGRTIGNVTYHPAWQFTDVGLRADLAEILEAITAFTTDALAADRIMRLPREELDGRCIAEELDDPELADVAWQILHRLGAGF